MPDSPKYWFPAKQYGWGWSLPVCWQGWTVFAAYIVLMMAGFFVSALQEHHWWVLAYVSVVTASYSGICWWKGEPPRWRWGDK